METLRPELHPVPVHSPWFHVAIDFVGPISPSSKSGNHYILTLIVTILLSGWMLFLFPPSVLQVLQLRYLRYGCLIVKLWFCKLATLMQIFMRMGIPRILTSDQGREFKNSLNEEMMQLLGIKYHLTTAYHPQVL